MSYNCLEGPRGLINISQTHCDWSIKEIAFLEWHQHSFELEMIPCGHSNANNDTELDNSEKSTLTFTFLHRKTFVDRC